MEIEINALKWSGNELRTIRNKRHAKTLSKQGEFVEKSRANSSSRRMKFILNEIDRQPSDEELIAINGRDRDDA